MSNQGIVSFQKRLQRKIKWVRTRTTTVWALLLLLCAGAARAQNEIFSSGDSYQDQFSGNCHTNNPPNIFAQLGMNPMACRGEVAPADSGRQCSMKGMRLLKQIGTTCYYCSPRIPPIHGIILPLDQVGYAAHQGYVCGEDEIDVNCSAICTKDSGGTQYTPPSPGEVTGAPGPISLGRNGPCEDYTGLDMSTPEGRAEAYRRCSDSLCRHNPDLQRCKGTNDQPPTKKLTATVQNGPCVPDGAWPPLVALESFTAQVANGGRDLLVDVTNNMAPKYDMTKSGEGVRYMQGLLMNIGFGSLSKAAPAVLRGIATKTPVKLQNPIYDWLPRAGSQTLPALPARTPLGLKVPVVLLNTPRPIQIQERAASCGLACIKMVVETVVRHSNPEAYYRALALGVYGQYDETCYRPGVGTGMNWFGPLLQDAGVQSTMATGQTLKDLFNATRNGNPAIVHLGPLTGGHAVVVDGFAQDAGKNWYVLGRDPFNLNLMDPITRQAMQDLGKRNYFAEAATDFVKDWSGWAVYTGK